MQFSYIINAAVSKEYDRPLMQKEIFPVSNELQQYLEQHQKSNTLPISYKELLHYEYTNSIKDEDGKHTHWEKVIYKKELETSLHQKLATLYEVLQSTASTHIQIQSIDFCEYANSMPFRINYINTKNNIADCFYIKSADASRIYGLAFEQLLSNNTINFLYHNNTLVEENIQGTPGDVFLQKTKHFNVEQKKKIAEEFIRFNERCFIRLLGDMRSYNFVVIENETNSYIIRAIDFDQQCYEGKLHLYLPQFYKENYEYVQIINSCFNEAIIEQIRNDERKQIAKLFLKNKQQLTKLLSIIEKEEISESYKVTSLKKQLNIYHKTENFSACKTMGAILKQQLTQLLHLS